MFRIEKISNRIGHNIAAYLKLNSNQEEVIAYGTFSMLQAIISIVFVGIFGLLFGVFVEALIISFSGAILRKYSGGVHASSPNTCTIIGTILCVGFSIVVSYLAKNISFKYIVLFIIFSISYSYYFIWKLAPVDSKAKPLKNIQKKQRLKRCSLIILSIMYGITTVMILLYKIFDSEVFLSYAVCIVVGVVWQSFTLTSTGHKFLGKVDAVFNFGKGGRNYEK